MRTTLFETFKNNFVSPYKEAVIICPGKSLITFKDKIDLFKLDKLTLGVNNTSCMNPIIHLYTNNQRLAKYGKDIQSPYVMFGSYIKPHNIPQHIGKKYIKVDYTDRTIDEPIEYKHGSFYGYYRGSGNLGIMILYTLGIKKIYIVGMDGYTMDTNQVHYYEDVNDEKKSSEEWATYDKKLKFVLNNLKQFIDFKIITPTIYEEHYDGSIL